MPQIGGYVLAGGKSSRMGTSKALLQLGGRALVERAVSKLARLCPDVKILGSDPLLARYASLVPDVHMDCGPLGGIEAALLDSRHDWNLILPVDVPFLPAWYLADWRWTALHREPLTARICMLATDETLHPALLLIHRDVLPYLTTALERKQYRLLSALEKAAIDLSAQAGVRDTEILLELQWDDFHPVRAKGDQPDWASPTPAQQAYAGNWFANLNTPEDFAEAEKHLDALDT